MFYDLMLEHRFITSLVLIVLMLLASALIKRKIRKVILRNQCKQLIEEFDDIFRHTLWPSGEGDEVFDRCREIDSTMSILPSNLNWYQVFDAWAERLCISDTGEVVLVDPIDIIEQAITEAKRDLENEQEDEAYFSIDLGAS